MITGRIVVGYIGILILFKKKTNRIRCVIALDVGTA